MLQGPDGFRRDASVFVEDWGRRVWETHIVKKTIPFRVLRRGCVRLLAACLSSSLPPSGTTKRILSSSVFNDGGLTLFYLFRSN